MRKRSLLFSLFTLAACGGGGSSNTTDPSLGAGAADPTQPAGGAPGAASAGAPTPAGTASGSGSSTGGAAPAAPRGHQRCGWIGPGDTAGAQTFAAHAEWFDAIHPDWYALNADGVSVRALQGADDPTVVQAAQAHHVVLMPLIAAVEDPSYVRNMIAGAATRSQLEQALVQLATQHGYDGVDIDFEHLWQASDRPGFSAFMTELAQALHAAGKRLSIAMPAQVDDNPNSAYDITVLASACDVVHIMGYDYHTLGTHEGPVAPLGWIDAVAKRAASTGDAAKFVLGLPNYGVTSTVFKPSQQAIAACPGYSSVDTHMASCPFGVYDPGLAPNCQTPDGHLYFEDLASMEQKVNVAKKYGLGGITYWTVGSEPNGFFEMIAKYY